MIYFQCVRKDGSTYLSEAVHLEKREKNRRIKPVSGAISIKKNARDLFKAEKDLMHVIVWKNVEHHRLYLTWPVDPGNRNIFYAWPALKR